MSSVAAEFQITRGGNAPHSLGCCRQRRKRFAVVLHVIDADRRGEADTLTISVDFEDHVMDGLAALSRYIVERSPHRRFQPNAGPMTADPDAAARRRSYAVAYRLCFHAPENTAPNRKRSRTNEEPAGDGGAFVFQSARFVVHSLRIALGGFPRQRPEPSAHRARVQRPAT